MSKTILTDECLSVGCSLYGALLKGCFPIKNFKGIYHLNHYVINSSTNNGTIEPFVSNHHQIPDFKSFTFEKNALKDKISITFYHSKKEIDEYLYTNEKNDNVLLISYDFICSEILKKYQNINQLKITFLIDNIGEVHIKGLESVLTKDNSVKIDLNKNIIKISKRGLYLSANESNKVIAELSYNEENLFKKDKDFIDFSAKKNSLESTFYNVKNLIQNKNLSGNEYEGKNIMTCMQEIENQINDNYNKIFDLSPIEDYLNKIVTSITPNDVAQEKDKMMNEVNKYQKSIDDGKTKLGQKELNDANNMLDYFRKKLYLVIDQKELKDLNKEFNAEKRKYF